MAMKHYPNPTRGHGQTIATRRYAWPDPLRRSRSKGDAAFLKTWGSRPTAKRREVRRAA